LQLIQISPGLLQNRVHAFTIEQAMTREWSNRHPGGQIVNPLESVVHAQLLSRRVPVRLIMPNGSTLGVASAAVTLILRDAAVLAHIAQGAVGLLADDYVEGRLEFDASLRELMRAAAGLMRASPTSDTAVRSRWVSRIMRPLRERARHSRARDALQVQHHYDVSDDFFALWLDDRRVYSCAYYRDPQMSLREAQEAKLDHICRKLLLKPGARFLDIGAGWGGLLLWAAEHYGCDCTGITLSKNQHAHVNRLIASKGLQGRVQMHLMDYRDVPEHMPFDRIASIGMFEHVGRINFGLYFGKIMRLLKPGGLLLNHSIHASGTSNTELGYGMGAFIEKHIFPGGELVHLSTATEALAKAGLEPLDLESLRPHYARTLWAWSDALEAKLDAALRTTGERTVRAYRMYLAGSAMCFEQGWITLFQTLAAKPDGDAAGASSRRHLPGQQSEYPFNREYIYRSESS
jgi:cyclopropane-fatty-acyl-phospholipid synthase